MRNLSKRRLFRDENRKKLNRLWRCFNDGWYGETIAVLFNLAPSIAIVVVLLAYDNHPTPKLPKGITLNAIVSVLATASKAALLFTTSSCLGQLTWNWFKSKTTRDLAHAQIFDDASRGPLGALGLFSSEPRKSMASLGAILTLLALAYDPFVQQVIHISTEVRYTSTNRVITKQATRFIASPMDQRFHQSLYRGIYSDRFDRVPTCSTGNCTFPRFSSVGICSKCSHLADSAFVGGCSLAFDDAELNLSAIESTDYQIANHTCRISSDLDTMRTSHSAPPGRMSTAGLKPLKSRRTPSECRLSRQRPISLPILTTKALAFHGADVCQWGSGPSHSSRSPTGR